MPTGIVDTDQIRRGHPQVASSLPMKSQNFAGRTIASMPPSTNITLPWMKLA